MPDLEEGYTLGPYRVEGHLGQGGMATVYKAYQPTLDRYVAIKVLPAHRAHEPGFARRFAREARAAARLTHPHILPVYDFGQEGDLLYIVMQYVEGRTLKEMLGQPMDLQTIADIISQVARALDYAHQRGVIHRDVKPSNVLIDENGWALLADFGLARMMESSEQLTASGEGIGTPAYMSPEQGQGLKVDARTDVYSLGVMLYEMLTGRVPYEAETPMGVILKHISEPLPSPRSLRPDLPEAVEQVVLKAMAKKPGDRYASAGEMARALTEALEAEKALSSVERAATVKPAMTEAVQAKPRRARRTWRGYIVPILLAVFVAFLGLNQPPGCETKEHCVDQARRLQGEGKYLEAYRYFEGAARAWEEANDGKLGRPTTGQQAVLRQLLGKYRFDLIVLALTLTLWWLLPTWLSYALIAFLLALAVWKGYRQFRRRGE